jgi:uncharacterized membrane protein YoaK (UPF0700 family)
MYNFESLLNLPMFRHTGQGRTQKHNIRLAALLCLTAGFVNVVGFLAFSVLTTNVTGHVAIFAEKLAQGDFATARVVGLWMFMFLLGAFLTSMTINNLFYNQRYSYVIPIVTEIIILAMVASYGVHFNKTVGETEFFAGSLLFAMGIQNALVSMISGSVVRTTHLTGMFTDLGIEMAAILKKEGKDKEDLKGKISLRLIIISFFFLGGILGGYLFKDMKYYTFYIPAGILVMALLYDVFRFKVIKLARKLTH